MCVPFTQAGPPSKTCRSCFLKPLEISGICQFVYTRILTGGAAVHSTCSMHRYIFLHTVCISYIGGAARKICKPSFLKPCNFFGECNSVYTLGYTPMYSEALASLRTEEENERHEREKAREKKRKTKSEQQQQKRSEADSESISRCRADAAHKSRVAGSIDTALAATKTT